MEAACEQPGSSCPHHAAASPPQQPKPSASQQASRSDADDALELREGEGSDAEGDAELAAFARSVLQRVQPDAELTSSSLRLLAHLLDGVTQRVLEEAQRISAAQQGPAAGGSSSGGTGAPPLTSLDIHKALKRVLPDAKSRPYLPADLKQAWHQDKQSLKGVKKQKLMGAAGERENDPAISVADAAELR